MKNLAPYGHAHVQYTLGLWINKDQNMTCALFVDAFGIKHNSLNNLEHLTTDLKAKYTIAVDMNGSSCIGVTLDWNY